jgi:hypothetical protein
MKIRAKHLNNSMTGSQVVTGGLHFTAVDKAILGMGTPPGRFELPSTIW